MCINFTYLNNAIPKKSHPFSHIDQLVYLVASHELLSYFDAFKGYYQISMAEEDMLKTSFVTNIGIYCDISMPFGLKNARADFQEGMNKSFRGLIAVIMEIYVDDIIVKSKKRESTPEDLKICFTWIRDIGIKLNPKKCTFGVLSGKCLGYLVSKREIEVMRCGYYWPKMKEDAENLVRTCLKCQIHANKHHLPMTQYFTSLLHQFLLCNGHRPVGTVLKGISRKESYSGSD